MSTRFRHETVLAAPPAEVFAVLVDPTSYAARYTAAGATDVEVQEIAHRPDGGVDVVSRRLEAGTMPRRVARLVQGAAQLVQHEDWGPPDDDGTRHATWRVETRGVPVEITGTTELHPVADATGGTATRLVETGTVTARLPVVGALIEKVAAEQSGGKLADEWRWLATRLTERLAGSGG